MRTLLFLTCAALIAAPLHAQVGVPPKESPFRDIENRMEVTFISGIFNAGKDPVGVAPQSGPYFGARYEVGFGSFVSLSGRAALVPSTRTVIDPAQPEGSRAIGEANSLLYLVDAGIGFNLTGARSFHHLAPSVSLAMGIVSDMQAADDGGYSLGPGFLFTMGGGVKWLVSEKWQVRFDAADHIFSISYPPSYAEPASDGTRARSGDDHIHTHNLALTVGLSYRFFR